MGLFVLSTNDAATTYLQFQKTDMQSFEQSVFKCQHFSLRNSKKFRTFEPFKFSNASFFYPYRTVEKFSNATLFRQIALQNLQRKILGFSETDLSRTLVYPYKCSLDKSLERQEIQGR